MKSLLRIVAPIMGAFLLAGCAGSGETPIADDAPMMCVLNPGEAADPEVPASEFMGQQVHFCCSKCKTKWESMDDAAKQAKLAAAK